MRSPESSQSPTDISESDFPIKCDQCSYNLTALGSIGRCPECGTPFHRRRRLYETYGREVFLKLPESAGENQERFHDIAIHLIAALLFFVVLELGYVLIFGGIDICLVPLLWSFLLTVIGYLRKNVDRLGPKKK